MIGQILMYLGERTFWFGNGALAKGALLLLLTALLVRLFAKSSASRRHLIWGLGLAGVLAVSVGAWLLPGWSLPAPATPEFSGAAADGARTVFVHAGGGEASAAAPAASAQPSASLYLMALWPTLLAAVWVLGAALLLLRVLLDQLAARGLARRAAVVEGSRLPELARALAAELGVRRLPELRESREIDSPATVGILRPRVLLPLDARKWSEQQLRSVLAHEMAHADRGDCGSQLLARVVCALHWPNPLVWWATRRLRAEREMAADDMALRAGSRASDYAGLLLQLVSAARPTPALRGALAMAGGSPLGERVARLLDPVRSRAGVTRRLIAVAGSALVALGLGIGCLGGAEPGGEGAEVDPAPIESVAPRGQAAMKVWFAVAKNESALGRQLIEALGGEAPRKDGIEIRQTTWRKQSGPILQESYLEGPRGGLSDFVDGATGRQRLGAEQVLLENLAGGRARTHVIDTGTRIDLDQPRLTVINDEVNRPEIEMRFGPADARRIHEVTSAHLGDRMLVVAGDGYVMAAPVVQSPLSDRGRITFGDNATESEARELAAAIGAVGAEQLSFPKHALLTAAEGVKQLVSEPRIPSRIPLTPGESRWVNLDICVDQSGAVTGVRTIGGNALEDAHQFTTAVRTWRYRPYLQNGNPTPFCYSTRIQAHPAP